MYGVKKLRKEIKINALGYENDVCLKWFNGMIGAIPVFENKEDALKYANNDESLVFEIVEV